MELIRQNPYHVIGILAGANQRTITKQKAKINALQKVGKSIDFGTDIELPEKPDRSNGAVEKAFANIEINQNKVINALFWFVNHNHLDETALNYLQSGELKKPEDIWQKITNGKEVSSKNFTAFNNLGTLKLSTAFANGSIDTGNLKEGIRLKTELLTSGNLSDFCRLVADETYTVDQNKELETFINVILEELNKQRVLDSREIHSLIGSIHPKLKSVVSEKLTATPFHNIERKTEQTKKKRNENPEDGLELGRNLYRDTKSDITSLSELLGKSDLKYRTTADKLAKEILQSGIDYFKEYQDDEELHDGYLGKDVIELFRIADSIAVGNQTKERISENIEGVHEWINRADERRKEKLIEQDLKYVIAKLERFKRLPDTIENADNLVTSCKPKLQNMKSALGADDNFYIQISSAVVNNVQGMLVTVINNAQQDPSVRYDLEELKSKVLDAIKVSDKLETLDMDSELKVQYNKNKRTLRSIFAKINSARSSISQSNSDSDSACYIATMAYGSYEHPQVIILRKFRDETLVKSLAGKTFIELYYWISPKLVKLLKGNSSINSFIRKFLNQFIKYIK